MKANKQTIQKPLFEQTKILSFWEKEWKDMPEFIQKDLAPYATIQINFANDEDRLKFFKLVNQKCTSKTLSVWYPKDDREKPSNFLYVDEN